MISEGSCSSSSPSITTFEDFLRSKNFDFNDNVDYSEFSVEFVAKMSKEQLIEHFHFDKKSAAEIYGLLGEERKSRGLKNSPSSAKGIFSFFKTKSERSAKFLEFFTPSETDYLGFDQRDHMPMDLLAASHSGHSKHFEQIIRSESKQLGLRKGYLVNQVTADGWTPLMYASVLGNDHICKFLLEHDASMKTKNSDGQTALMLASSYGHCDILQLLFRSATKKAKMFKNQDQREMVKNEVLLNLADKNGQTALHYAVYYNQEDAVKVLLMNGADPNIPDHLGMTPTLISCYTTNRGVASKKCLIELIKFGGKVNYRNKRGQTGNDLASNPTEIMELLNLYGKQKSASLTTKSV